MNKEVKVFNESQSEEDKEICNYLFTHISESLPNAENKHTLYGF